jgi:prepilin-type N-terminal cleavage/methylation domain-containing protein
MKRSKELKGGGGGFTLIELVVVMAIIAVLAMLVVGAIIVARNTAKETTNRSNAKVAQTALEAKFASNRQYPTLTTGDLGTAGNLTLLGLTTDSLSTSGCASPSYGVNVTTSSTAAYTLDVYTSECKAATYNGKDQVKSPQ